MGSNRNSGFPWRPVVLGPLAVTLFAFALYFYNDQRIAPGLILLEVAFAVPMIWIVLVARDPEGPESPVRQFVPRLTAILVLGSVFLAFVMRVKNPRIAVIEAGSAIFYAAAGALAWRIFNAKPKRPTLTALSGGNQRPRQKREAKLVK